MRLTLVPVLRSTVRARVPVLRVRYRYMRTMQSTRVRYARVRVPVPAFADHPVFAVFSISPEYGTCTAVRYYRYLKNHRELQYTLCQPMPTDAPSCQIMLNSVHYAGRCWRGALCRKIMLASGRDPKAEPMYTYRRTGTSVLLCSNVVHADSGGSRARVRAR